MSIDKTVQRDLDMAEGYRPWTKAYAQKRAADRFGLGTWVRVRKVKGKYIYRNEIGVDRFTLGRGMTWEETWKNATNMNSYSRGQ